MKPTTDLGRYAATLFRGLERHLRSYEKRGGRGSLHRFRVTSKHTRSLLRFLSTMKGGRSADSMLADLRSIFRLAGGVRESQILMEWMHLHRKPGLIRHLADSETHGCPSARLHKRIPGFLHKLNARSKDLVSLADRVTSLMLADHRERMIEKFLEELSDGILPGRWHGARKRIKTLQHIDEWPGISGTGGRSSEAWDRHLDAFQAVVGTWHDIGALLAWFERAKEHLRGNAVLERECDTAMTLLEEHHAQQFIAVKKELARLERYARTRKSRASGKG